MKDFKIDENNKHETGFVIPDSYFDDLFEKVNNKIEQNPVVVTVFYRQRYWLFAVAALFVVSLSVLLFQNYNKEIGDEIEIMALEDTITVDDIAAHLTNQDITDLEEALYKYSNEDQLIINLNL